MISRKTNLPAVRQEDAPPPLPEPERPAPAPEVIFDSDGEAEAYRAGFVHGTLMALKPEDMELRQEIRRHMAEAIKRIGPPT